VKVEIKGRILKRPDGVYRVPIIIGLGEKARRHDVMLDSPPYDPNSAEPTRVFKGPELSHDGMWAYRDSLVVVKDGDHLSLDEVLVGIKHAVLRHDKAFERMRREIEAFENMEPADIARREQIPQSVRLFVWQRDQGRCVRCGSAEKLEFDHIIPVAKGGSSTERNVQLLCEQCNRAKGSSI
jgi:hypothetical protein